MVDNLFNRNGKRVVFNIYTTKGLVQVTIDTLSLQDECIKAVTNFRYKNPIYSVGIIIVGRDVIARVCNPVPEELFLDFSTDKGKWFVAGDFGLIFNSSIEGIAVMPIPELYKNNNPIPLTDRQRMTQAHLESVGKLLAANGLVQKGEYKDGWMACLRSMSQMLGIDIPNYVPFKDMRYPSPEELRISSEIEEELQCLPSQ